MTLQKPEAEILSRVEFPDSHINEKFLYLKLPQVMFYIETALY